MSISIGGWPDANAFTTRHSVFILSLGLGASVGKFLLGTTFTNIPPQSGQVFHNLFYPSSQLVNYHVHSLPYRIVSPDVL